MSYTSSYANRPPSRKGLAITIGLHAVVFAGVMAMPAITAHIEEKEPVIMRPIPMEPDPSPPPEPIEKPQSDPRPVDVKTPAGPIVEPPPLPGWKEPAFRDLGDEIAMAGSGTDSGFPTTEMTFIPEPEIVEAQLNRRYSRSFQPAYPPGLLRLGTEGLVTVRVLVGTDGRPRQIELVDSPHPDFWSATRKHALKKWRFKPATRDGQAYDSWITLKVQFTIND